MAVVIKPEHIILASQVFNWTGGRRYDQHNIFTTSIKNPMKILKPWIVALMMAISMSASAAGNLAQRAERLDPLVIDAVDGFSVRSYKLETGRFYRWSIQGDGRDGYKILVSGLFENAWIQKISIDDKDVLLYGLQAVEIDGEDRVDIFFLPVIPGSYKFYVEHLRSEGFEGEFIVE